jgi:hypothetical protein
MVQAGRKIWDSLSAFRKKVGGMQRKIRNHDVGPAGRRHSLEKDAEWHTVSKNQ